jgi:hypothetical protein
LTAAAQLNRLGEIEARSLFWGVWGAIALLLFTYI